MQGSQRLSIEKLKAWEGLRYGMFIHFGMSTYDGDEYSRGDRPSSLYAPDRLEVDQWVSVARDAGMKYAVLTTKHVSGHCLWPTKYNDYHVGTSGNRTDVVGEFVKACERRGVLPGFYYCAWDNHNRFGSVTPNAESTEHVAFPRCYTTQKYREFQANQMEELLTEYGKVAEVWIDIPLFLGQDGRNEQYDQIARLQPDAVIMMNGAFSHGEKLDQAYQWPTDLLSIERGLPCASWKKFGYSPWWKIGYLPGEEKDYYIPGEVCDTIGWGWFYMEDDPPRSDKELLGMYLVSIERGCNLLLDVPPDRHGVLPREYVEALMRLGGNIERVG